MSTLNPDLLQPTCRVCLQNKREEMCSIFDVDAGVHNLPIYEQIELCAGTELVRDEKLPSLICSDCYRRLRESFRFRTDCRNSNEYLKDFLTKGLEDLKQENSTEQNPLSILESTPPKKSARLQNKIKLRNRLLSPSSQTIKKEYPSRSPSANSDFINESVDDKDDLWFEIGYDDDEDDISCGENIDIDIKKEIEEPEKKKTIKGKRKPKAKAEKLETEVSSDGATLSVKKSCGRKKTERQSHICEVCGNIYKRRHSLEYHMKRHRDEKPFECELCGYAFYSSFELNRHMRKHTGSRPYKCSYCPRAFGDQSTLIKHERVHRNERPFKCETCGKSFSYTGVLKYHKLTHTGEKPYSCEICGKCFPRPHNLRDHLKTLQHQNDPRVAMLLQNIRKNNESETLKVDLLKINT